MKNGVRTGQGGIVAGCAVSDITPRKPVFLAGYPHAERISDGVNDPLLASALFLDDGNTRLMMISLDLLFISPATASMLRGKIEMKTGIPSSNIMISCTHTHSGPLTCKMLSRRGNSYFQSPEDWYMGFMAGKVLEAAVKATRNPADAEIAVTSSSVTGAGCNRHDPKGPRDPEIGIIAVRNRDTRKLMSLSVFYSMHPTVMHEDSRKVSSDFPGYARMLVRNRLGKDIVVVYHTGTAGNQSPRYHVKGQTFSEARRIGHMVGNSVIRKVAKLPDSDFRSNMTLMAASCKVELPVRVFPTVTEAEAGLELARARYARLLRENVGHGLIRTGECNIFGAEKTLALAKAQGNGDLFELLRRYNPAELMMLGIGDLRIIGFPCEIFVEYGLRLKRKSPLMTFPVGLANGELQGYIVTQRAANRGGYEAWNAIFAAKSGVIMVSAALKLIKKSIAGNE